MLIDSHCHVDRYKDPARIVRECVSENLKVVAVTNLPSHYEIALHHLSGQAIVVPALGMHPLAARQAMAELDLFASHVKRGARMIGEIGLDYSRAGKATISIQEQVLESALKAVGGLNCFITLHSRGAEKDVLAALCRHRIRSAVFHWYSGSVSVLDEILECGHLTSINPSMISTDKGRTILKRVPIESLLAETDGPFSKIAGAASRPGSVRIVYEEIAREKDLPFRLVEEILARNFKRACGAGIADSSHPLDTAQ